MTRKKSNESQTIDAEIAKFIVECSSPDSVRQNSEKLKDFQEQKRCYEADVIIASYPRSGKSLEEVFNVS